MVAPRNPFASLSPVERLLIERGLVPPHSRVGLRFQGKSRPAAGLMYRPQVSQQTAGLTAHSDLTPANPKLADESDAPLGPWRSVGADALSGLGRALMAAGAGGPGGGWSAFGPAFTAGIEGAQDRRMLQQEAAERKEDRDLRREQARRGLEAEQERERMDEWARQQLTTYLNPDNAASLNLSPDAVQLARVYAATDPQRALELLTGQAMKAPDKAEPHSALAKAKADLDAGFIDPQIYARIVEDELRPPQGPQPPETWRQVTIDGRPMLQSSRGDLKEMPGAGGGPFAGNALDAQAMNVLLTGDPSSPQYAAAHSHLSQPRVNFDPNSGKMVAVTPNLSWARPPAQMGEVETGGMSQPGQSGLDVMQVPGATITSTPGNVKLSAEEATKFTALEEGEKDIAAAVDILAPQGKLNTGSITAGQSALGVEGVPFTEGRQARQRMKRGIEAVLRAMTGAAAPESEVERYMDMFFPSPLDGETSANAKLQAAQAWTSGILQKMRAGRPQLQGGGLNAPGGAPSAADPLGILD